jgi:hypothetical protein
MISSYEYTNQVQPDFNKLRTDRIYGARIVQSVLRLATGWTT